ncbi:MAG: hypothetical protein QXH03_08385 [Candidatus Bathyarchaeia archaeon]
MSKEIQHFLTAQHSAYSKTEHRKCVRGAAWQRSQKNVEKKGGKATMRGETREETLGEAKEQIKAMVKELLERLMGGAILVPGGTRHQG